MSNIVLTNKGDASKVNNGSTRYLFVEGCESSNDEALLKDVLGNVNVRGIGSSSCIERAAAAFKADNRMFYFVVDRDHHTQKEVNQSWKDLRTDKSNIVIWRKKEFESYFIDPEFLLKSKYIKSNVTADIIKNKIISIVNKQIYWYALCRTIISVRERIKAKWIELPSFGSRDFNTRDKSLNVLLNSPELSSKLSDVRASLSASRISRIYDSELKKLTGGILPVQWGVGKWLELVPSKAILNSLICSSNLFIPVVSLDGKVLESKEAMHHIIKDIMSNPRNVPSDFVELKTILENLSKRN